MNDALTELGIGTAAGAILRHMAESRAAARDERRHLHAERMAEKKQQAETIEAARRFALAGGGTWMRRLIVVSIVSFLTWLLFYAGVFTDLPVMVGELQEKTGLFGREKVKMVWHELRGLVVHPEMWTTLRVVSGFYFGQAIK